MKLDMLGFEHDKSSEHLIRAFIPECRTSLVATPDADGTIICALSASSTDMSVVVRAVMRDGTRRESSLTEAVNGDNKQNKNLTKRALYRLMSGLTGRTLPWGILVGIRPTKLIRDLEEGGCPQEQLAQVLSEQYYVSRDKIALALSSYQNEKKVLEQVSRDGVSVYVGIPFCPSRCYYCSFVSASMDSVRKYIPDYLSCLVKEIKEKGKIIRESGRPVQSIYVGGGTPTVLEERDFERVIRTIARYIPTDALQEFTVECGRPDTITREKLEILKKYGVGRISINPQSMNDATLERIGRRHSAQQIIDAFHMARELGFHEINMDLIAGLEGETAAEFAASLDQVLALEPENITLHTLCVKRGSDIQTQHLMTDYFAGEVEEMLSLAYNKLMQQHYNPYYMYRQKNMMGNFENVSYCRNEAYGIYNVIIMQEYHTIAAMGAGSVTKLVSPGKIVRLANPKYPHEYIERISELKGRLPIQPKEEMKK